MKLIIFLIDLCIENVNNHHKREFNFLGDDHMLKVRIQRAYIEVSPEDLSQIEKAFSLAIDRFDHVVRDIEVTMTDVNGPRGGVDKRCSVQLRMYPRGLVVVRSAGSSLIETVNEACDRIRQVISKRLSKKKSRLQSRLINENDESVLLVN